MSRPKRKAAADAQLRMQQIFEWEEAPEHSKLFQDCAAAIDSEFEQEKKTKRVRVAQVEESELSADSADSEASEELASCDEGDADEPTQEDLDFVEPDDFPVEDSEWVPQKQRPRPAAVGASAQAPSRADDASEDESQHAEDSEEEAEMTDEDSEADSEEEAELTDEDSDASGAETETEADAAPEGPNPAPAAPVAPEPAPLEPGGPPITQLAPAPEGPLC